MDEQKQLSSHIGTLNEGSLHAGLKAWYAREGDASEVQVGNYIIDLVRDGTLIEIQTGNFSSIKKKVTDLVKEVPLLLVYPVAEQKWILKLSPEGGGIESRRKSPKRGRLEDVFTELVSFPEILAEDNFTLEIVLIQEEELRRRDARRGWRRGGWVIEERNLLSVVGVRRYGNPAEIACLLPDGLPDKFTTADIALAGGMPRRLAQRMTYCLRAMGAIRWVGKVKRAYLYERAP